MKPTKIEKLKGILCKSIDGEFFLRTYNEDGTFNDYGIRHNDLEIQILDDDAYIYEKDGDLYINYSPKTLGIEIKDE